MKKLFYSIFLLVLLIALASCNAESTQTLPEDVSEQSAEKQPDSKAASQEGFGSTLVGQWNCVSQKHNGEAEIYFPALTFFADGTFLKGTALDYSTYLDEGIALEKASTNGNNLYMTDDWYQVIYNAPRDAQDSAEQDIQIAVTYEISDISKSVDKDVSAPLYFKKYEDDQLVLHVTGTKQTSPTNVLEIDSTFTYEKNYPLFEDTYFGICMQGKWVDNFENQWEFFFQKHEQTNKHILKFQMTDTDGKTHQGSYFETIFDKEDPECVEHLIFVFEDFSTDTYDIVAFDGKSLILQSDNRELLLKKSSDAAE